MTSMIHLTSQQTMPAIAGVVAGWLMVHAGASKRLLTLRTPARCAACGKRRTAGGCDCTATT
jgi:hypothetical protein